MFQKSHFRAEQNLAYPCCCQKLELTLPSQTFLCQLKILTDFSQKEKNVRITVSFCRVHFARGELCRRSILKLGNVCLLSKPEDSLSENQINLLYSSQFIINTTIAKILSKNKNKSKFQRKDSNNNKFRKKKEI